MKLQSLLKELKEKNRNKWKNTLSSWTGRFGIVKCLYYLEQYTESKQFLSKSEWHFLQKYRDPSQGCRDSQGTIISQNNTEKEQSWRPHLPDFKIYYKAIVIHVVPA